MPGAEFLVIDPATGVATTIPAPGNASNEVAAGGVLGKDGKIYTMPRDYAGIMELDTDTGTVTDYPQAVIGGSGDKWMGGALDLNGAVYGAPYGVS